jgi:hypothetical protein
MTIDDVRLVAENDGSIIDEIPDEVCKRILHDVMSSEYIIAQVNGEINAHLDGYRTTKEQDSEGDWYWIPENKLIRFQMYIQAMDGAEYSDCPEWFDEFENEFSKYRTNGHKDNRP